MGLRTPTFLLQTYAQCLKKTLKITIIFFAHTSIIFDLLIQRKIIFRIYETFLIF